MDRIIDSAKKTDFQNLLIKEILSSGLTTMQKTNNW